MNAFRRKRFNGDPGDTIQFSRYGESIPHLYVVVTPPDGDPPRVVIASVTSKRSHSDTTTILLPPDHPWINRPSVVNYGKATLVRVDYLLAQIKDNIADVHRPLKPEKLEIIQQGILKSKRTPRHIKRHCRTVFRKQT